MGFPKLPPKPKNPKDIKKWKASKAFKVRRAALDKQNLRRRKATAAARAKPLEDLRAKLKEEAARRKPRQSTPEGLPKGPSESRQTLSQVGSLEMHGKL